MIVTLTNGDINDKTDDDGVGDRCTDSTISARRCIKRRDDEALTINVESGDCVLIRRALLISILVFEHHRFTAHLNLNDISRRRATPCAPTRVFEQQRCHCLTMAARTEQKGIRPLTESNRATQGHVDMALHSSYCRMRYCACSSPTLLIVLVAIANNHPNTF